MFQFNRVATVKNAADLPAAIRFGAEVCGYLNKTYALKLKVGVELFGEPTVHWQFEAESLDEIAELNAKMMQDREYVAMLEKVRDLWLEGSLKDAIVNLLT